MSRKRPGDVIGDDGRVRIVHPACSTCIFRPGNPMHLPPGRAGEVIDGNLEADALLTCHATLPGNEGGHDPAVCGSYWAAHWRDTICGRLAYLIVPAAADWPGAAGMNPPPAVLH